MTFLNPFRETYKPILDLIQKTVKTFSKAPHPSSRDERKVFMECLRQAHTSLYYCIGEITQVLEICEERLLSDCIENLFAAFSQLFEANDNFYRRTINYFRDLEKKEKMIREYNLGTGFMGRLKEERSTNSK